MSRQVKKKKYSPRKMKMPGDRGRPPVPKPRPARTMVSRSEKENLRQLFNCVGEDDINCVRKALKKGFDVKQEIDISFDTLLNYCSYSGSLEMTKLLLEHDFDINHRNVFGLTPLLGSIISKKHDIAKLFIEKGADLNISDEEGNSPLIMAAKNIDTDLTTILVEYGADINHQNINGDTAVNIFASKKDHRLTIGYLISKGGDINHQNQLGNTPLIISTMHDNIETTEQLILRGADINIRNSDGNTALIIAADLEYDNSVKLLLDYGGNVRTISDSKYYKKYIDMDSDYYAFCKKFASSKCELNRETIIRRRDEIITEIRRELSITGDLNDLKQIEDFFKKLTPDYLLSILHKIDEKFFIGETFPMFERNECCVILCLDKCTLSGSIGECSMDRSKTIKIVIDKNVFINFFKKNGYIRDGLEPCEGLLECLLQTLEHEFLHGIMGCGCNNYENSSIMPQGIKPVSGLRYEDKSYHSKIFMRILYNRFGHETFYHGQNID